MHDYVSVEETKVCHLVDSLTPIESRTHIAGECEINAQGGTGCIGRDDEIDGM